MEQKTLLVVEDVEMNRSVVKHLLKNDFNILEAENGVQALDVLEHNQVDLVLLDIVMPEMNGIEVLEHVKKHPEWDHIGFLVATSKKEKTERLALSAGADDVVSKPYDPIIIRQRLRNIIANKEISHLQAEDIKGISITERRQVDTTLYELRDLCKAIQSEPDNIRLTQSMNNLISNKVDFLIDLLTNREEF